MIADVGRCAVLAALLLWPRGWRGSHLRQRSVPLRRSPPRRSPTSRAATSLAGLDWLTIGSTSASCWAWPGG